MVSAGFVVDAFWVVVELLVAPAVVLLVVPAVELLVAPAVVLLVVPADVFGVVVPAVPVAPADADDILTYSLIR
jgi:hypothetical protein